MDGKRDRTERRRHRRSEESRLRSIVEHLADGIVIVDSKGAIRFANPAAEALFGRSRSQLVGTDLGFPVVQGESTEVDVRRSDGKTVTAELRVVDVDWEGAAGLLVSLRDITDRKRAVERERQLDRERTARAEAEAASQAKSEFLAMMSHELRTPLNAVIGYADLLDLGIAGPLTSDQHQQLSRIRTSGRHLLGLVNEVLDLAKIEAGRLSVTVAVGRAGDAADAALSLVQTRADDKGIRFVGECLGESDAKYEGDEDRVRQILVNLLTNAVKFTEPGGEVALECGTVAQPDPEARVRGSGQWVYFSIRDTGVGIESKQLPLIFDPFVQGESGRTRSNDGSGLGLTISRRLARLMGGDLTVRSTPGAGSVFTLWLPSATTTKAEPTPPEWQESADGLTRLHGVAGVGELLLQEIATVLEVLVVCVRNEELAVDAKALKFSQLVDHYPSFLADLGGMLIAIEEARGQPSSLLTDGTEIQRLIAERHGAQRGRLGSSLEMVRREYALLREELASVLRRRARGIPDSAIDEGLVILNRVLEQAEESSVRGFLRTRPTSLGRAASSTSASSATAEGAVDNVSNDRP
jgi:signal transduction histidine kinase